MRRISTRFIRLRTETSRGFLRETQWNAGSSTDTSGGFLRKRQLNVEFHKTREIISLQFYTWATLVCYS